MATRVEIKPSYEWSKEAATLGVSHRELEVFALVLEGFSNKQVGEILKIKHQSVKNHMYSLGKKLAVKNIGQAVVVAIHLNLMSVEERAGDIRISYEEAEMMKVYRQIIEGVTKVPGMKDKDRIAIRAFLLAHGMDVYEDKKRLESEGGSSEEKRK
jgi:DNA-binding CsgD family transcriptional regulator